jgi:hypothetical protein
LREVILNHSLQNAIYLSIKTSGLVLFFAAFAFGLIGIGPVIYPLGPELISGDHPIIYYLAGAVLITVNLALLYGLFTKQTDFGKLAIGYCGCMWLLGNGALFYDAGSGFLGPSGVETVFWTNIWWVFWFFFFHGMFL